MSETLEQAVRDAIVSDCPTMETDRFEAMVGRVVEAVANKAIVEEWEETVKGLEDTIVERNVKILDLEKKYEELDLRYNDYIAEMEPDDDVERGRYGR